MIRARRLWTSLLLLTAMSHVLGGQTTPLNVRRDRVGFPANYAGTLEQVRHAYLPGRDKIITVFVNALAAKVTELEQLPYPAGSAVVVEWADPRKTDKGDLIRDEAGRVAKGPVTRVDVMRREPGFGAQYGADRAGEWEFTSFHADGRAMTLPDGAVACARCHRSAGAERDYVFAGRFPLQR
jgi:hypothetical protein